MRVLFNMYAWLLCMMLEQVWLVSCLVLPLNWLELN